MLEWVRAAAHGAVLSLLVLVLAACSAASLLTDAPSPSGGEPRGKSVPPVAFQQITGVPPGKLAELRAALSSAGGNHDIGFVEGNFQSGVFSLAGNFRANNDSAGVSIVYTWQLRDADGVLVATIDGEDNAGVYSGKDPWAAVSPAVLERIARRTAEEMARKLADLGYAARLSGLTSPPAEYFASAAPDAHREIDFETLNGPGRAVLGASMFAGADQVVEHVDITPTVASVDPLPNEALLTQNADPITPSAAPPTGEDNGGIAALDESGAQKPGKQPKAAEAKATAKPAKPGQRPIRAVAVIPVKGSPGGGDAELTAAMRKTLSAAGWPVVSKPQADALTIVGRVKVAEKGQGSEAVSVRWVVKSPDGKTLGDVKQANEVPKGSLDSGWGPAAVAVAEAAAPGIFDIVKRFR